MAYGGGGGGGQRDHALAIALIGLAGTVVVVYGGLVSAGNVTPFWQHDPEPPSVETVVPETAVSVAASPDSTAPAPTLAPGSETTASTGALAIASPTELSEFLAISPCQGGVIQIAADLSTDPLLIEDVSAQLDAGHVLATKTGLAGPHVSAGNPCGVDGWIVYFGPFGPQDPTKTWCDQLGASLKASPEIQKTFENNGSLELPFFRESSGKRSVDQNGNLYRCGS